MESIYILSVEIFLNSEAQNFFKIKLYINLLADHEKVVHVWKWVSLHVLFYRHAAGITSLLGRFLSVMKVGWSNNHDGESKNPLCLKLGLHWYDRACVWKYTANSKILGIDLWTFATIMCQEMCLYGDRHKSMHMEKKMPADETQ